MPPLQRLTPSRGFSRDDNWILSTTSRFPEYERLGAAGMMLRRSEMTRHALAGGIAWVVAASACRAAPPPVDARILTDWMRAQYALVRAERLSPPVASRVFAYGAVALYEGVAAGSPRLRSLAGQLTGCASCRGPSPASGTTGRSS